MAWKLLLVAAGIGEVASERNTVEGAALLQRGVGVHTIGQKLSGVDCESDSLLKQMAEGVAKHDALMLSDADGPADFAGLVSASKDVDAAGEKFGETLKGYFMGLHEASAVCLEEAPEEDVDAICAINGLIGGIMKHFDKVEPTFGKSPLAICKPPSLLDVKKDVAMWLKAVGLKPEAGDKARKPEGGDKPRKPEGGDKPPKPEGGDKPPKPEGGDKPPKPEGGDKPPKPERGDKPPAMGGNSTASVDCPRAWATVIETAQEGNKAFAALFDAVVKHGEALANAGDLKDATPEELKDVCEVGMGMAYVRGIAAVVSGA